MAMPVPSGPLSDAFEQALEHIPTGYSTGFYGGGRWNATVRRSPNDRRISLFAEELSGNDIVSFNLYRLKSGQVAFKPCEMPAEKVIDFVLNYKVEVKDASGSSP